MSHAKRDELWKEEASKAAETPGPGALDPFSPNWKHGGALTFTKDERFPKQRDTAPGPGTYELLDD